MNVGGKKPSELLAQSLATQSLQDSIFCKYYKQNHFPQ